MEGDPSNEGRIRKKNLFRVPGIPGLAVFQIHILGDYAKIGMESIEAAQRLDEAVKEAVTILERLKGDERDEITGGIIGKLQDLLVDDDRNIYEWNGSSVRFLRQFQSDHQPSRFLEFAKSR